MGFIEEVSFSDMGVQTILSLTELGFEGADQVVEKLVESCNKKKEQETLGDTSRGQASVRAARSKARSKEAAKNQCRKRQEAEEEKEPKPKKSRNEQDKKGQGKKAKDK